MPTQHLSPQQARPFSDEEEQDTARSKCNHKLAGLVVNFIAAEYGHRDSKSDSARNDHRHLNQERVENSRQFWGQLCQEWKEKRAEQLVAEWAAQFDTGKEQAEIFIAYRWFVGRFPNNRENYKLIRLFQSGELTMEDVKLRTDRFKRACPIDHYYQRQISTRARGGQAVQIPQRPFLPPVADEEKPELELAAIRNGFRRGCGAYPNDQEIAKIKSLLDQRELDFSDVAGCTIHFLAVLPQITDGSQD